VLEAFACATPAIVSSAGGSPEAVQKSGGGFVYRNDGELLDAIHAIAGDPAQRQALSAKARVAYENYYCEDRYISEYLTLVEEALSPR